MIFVNYFFENTILFTTNDVYEKLIKIVEYEHKYCGGNKRIVKNAKEKNYGKRNCCNAFGRWTRFQTLCTYAELGKTGSSFWGKISYY